MPIETVSVIILTHNGREHLETCLASLSHLDFPQSQLEIVVVDNASTDGSGEMIASRFPHARVLRSETNLGFSRGANLGASRAAGGHLAFLNDDMRVDRDWLKALVDAAAGDERLACVGSAIMNWEGTGIDFVGRPDDAFSLANGQNIEHLQERAVPPRTTLSLFVSAGAALVRADLFREVGGFDPAYFMYHEDVDLCWRFWLRGYHCALCPGSVTYHHGGASSRKLPAEYVQGLAQKHTLMTLFKNLEAENLNGLLPLVLYALLERGRWLEAARSSTARAVHECLSSADELMAKRADIQRTRVVSDAQLFSTVGHPFAFLLRQERYETIKSQLARRGPEAESNAAAESPTEATAAITGWLDAAHFLYERSLITALDQGENEHAAKLAAQEELSRVLASRVALLSAELAARAERVEALSDELTTATASLTAQLAEVRASLSAQLAEGRASLSTQLEDREGRIRALSAELAQLRSSRGWRLLSAYAGVKDRYLLPVYRRLVPRRSK